MLAELLLPQCFDGRDVADADQDTRDVVGYVLLECPSCGTERDASYPFCCDFASELPLERELAPC